MNIYVGLNVLLITGYYLLLSINSFRVEVIEEKKKYRVKPIYAVLFLIPILIMAVTRDKYFGDTYMYSIGYDRIPLPVGEFIGYLQSNPKDFGFSILSWLIKLFGFDYRGLFFVVALIQCWALYHVYQKYSPNYYLSVLLFVLSTDYYSWMFNGIRQFLAVSIVFAGTSLILERKYTRMILLILLASTFHQSALLMIPFIFLVNGEAFNKRMLLIAAGIVLSLVFLSQFTNLMDGVLQNTQYKNVVSDYQYGDFSEDNGTNPIRVLVYAVPTIISLVGMKIIRKKGGPIINLSTNMSLISTGIYIISIFTSGIFIGRLPIYFSLWNYILLPWEINNVFKEKDRIFLTALLLFFYCIFFNFQMSTTWKIY